MVEFRWVAIIALWTMLMGPILHRPPTPLPESEPEAAAWVSSVANAGD